MAPAPKRSKQGPQPKRSKKGPQSKPASEKAKVLDVDLNVDLQLPRAFSIFPLPLRTSIKENWEADLLVSLFDPIFDTEPHKRPHYSIRSLDANDDVATIHGHAFASLQKANFELMRLVLSDKPRVWKTVKGEPGSENPEFVRAQNVAGFKASKTGGKAIGWGFDTAGCLTFWEKEGGGKGVLTGLFVQRMKSSARRGGGGAG